MAASPDYNLADLDEEEEPLFADDIEDEDLPPLPPPMPPLSHLSQAAGRSGNRDNAAPTVNANADENFGAPGPSTSSQAVADGDDEQGPLRKKRKPLLTLSIDRIFSEKGLPYLEKEFPKLKFKGKGHEASDLKFLLQQYEQWANMLFPKFTFKDVTDRVESLASKKEFKSQLVRMRRRLARGESPLLSDNEDTEEQHLETPLDIPTSSVSPYFSSSENTTVNPGENHANENTSVGHGRSNENIGNACSNPSDETVDNLTERADGLTGVGLEETRTRNGALRGTTGPVRLGDGMDFSEGWSDIEEEGGKELERCGGTGVANGLEDFDDVQNVAV